MSFNTNHHDYSKLLANLSARLERCLKAEPEVDHRHELALISAEAQIINRHLLDQFIASLDNEGSVRISVSGEVIPGAAQRGCPLFFCDAVCQT